MMDVPPHARGGRGRGVPAFVADGVGPARRTVSRNRQWVADQQRSNTATPNGSGGGDGERWVRGGSRGWRGRPGNRGLHRLSHASNPRTTVKEDAVEIPGEQEEMDGTDVDEPVDEPEPEDREKFYQELVKAREIERKKAIADGMMDDPLVAKRLEDAITLVGTCTDMCPRFERYRRERENNLFEWETIPGTKRVDHKRAVKMYERAAGDKTLPSDLRPPIVLKRTLDYLFHDLLPRGGFSQTFNFIRDRSRAVRNDFTMQHDMGPLAIECHDRCARFHILALHFERDRSGFSIALEEQQLMNTLQSLKEFYEDQRGRYESPTELEMRVYHRLIHIRDQKERHEDVPAHITDHPVFKLTTKFRLHVQAKSAPIGKTTPLVVDEQGLRIFGDLAIVLREQGNVVMIYLVACLLERLFGKETIDDIESLRGELTIPDLIDGSSAATTIEPSTALNRDLEMGDEVEVEEMQTLAPTPLKPSATEWLSNNFGSKPTASAIFGPSSDATLPPPAEESTSAFAPPPPTQSTVSAFSSLSSSPNPFGAPTFKVSTAPKSVFGAGASSASFGLPAESASTSTSPFGSSATEGSSKMPNFFASSLSKSNSFTGQDAFLGQPMGVTPSQSSSSMDTTKPPNDPPPLFPTFTSSSSSTLNPAAPTFTPFTSSSQTVLPAESAPPPITKELSQPDVTASTVPAISTPPPSILFAPPAATDSISPRSAVKSAARDSPQSVAQGKPRLPIFTGQPPPLHKINTTSLETSTATPPAPNVFHSSSPSNPPPLNKLQPISLPSTPTSPVKLTSIKSWIGSFKEQVSASSSQEPLSPLYLNSPTMSPVPSFNTQGSSSIATTTNDTPSSSPAKPKDPSLSNGKGKQPAADLDAMATSFSRTSLVVRECFGRWQQRATDRAAWIEACQHSDTYRQKIKRQRVTDSSARTKKRILSTASTEAPQKRARRRIASTYQPPRTDDELARRFKENHKEHERRWVKGSFLEVVRAHVKSKYGSSFPAGWRVWLSMNPENDGTAIWLERKFDAPASGQWVSETVFSIPLRQKDNTTASSPGIIAFECTPLERVSDDLERKFRILDDCTRLRDMIRSLPPKRAFVPTLLVFCWADGSEQNSLPSDFLDMITKLVQESVLGSYHVLFISSVADDLDQKLGEALGSLTFDIEGQLVQSLTLQGVFKLFQDSLVSFYSEWIGNCSLNGVFDWVLYARLIEFSVNALNGVAHGVLKLVEADSSFDPLPSIDSDEITNTESAYNTIMPWLADNTLGDGATAISRDLLSHRSTGRDFPPRTFLDHLRDLAEHRTQAHVGNSVARYNVLKAEITPAVEQFQLSLQSLTVKLQQVLALRVRRSPKRRCGSEETDFSSNSPMTKRMKLSSSFGSSVSHDLTTTTPTSPEANGRSSPSPSVSTVSATPTGAVTIGMLRALTKDVRKRFGGSRLVN